MIGKLALITALASLAQCKDKPDQAIFGSRPDMIPAELVVHTHEEDLTHDGAIFVSPWSTGDLPGFAPGIGPHIYNKKGDLIWSGYGSTGNVIGNFMPRDSEYGDEEMVSFYTGQVSDIGTGYGSYRLMDNQYKITKELGLKLPYTHDFHEFQFTGKHTAAFSTYQQVHMNLSAYNQDLEDGWVWNCVLTEIDTRTDEVLFEWNSVDHVAISESQTMDKLNDYGYADGQAFDYLHMNSIAKDKLGNFLMSARHTWTVYYIDGKTGEVLWRMNNSEGGINDWDIDENATFAYQHHARWVEPKIIGEKQEDGVRYMTIFDNEQGGEKEAFRDESRGIMLKLELYHDKTFNSTDNSKGKVGKVTLLHEYNVDGDQKVSGSQGSVQVLDNGNVFIGWGNAGTVSEYTLEGKQIFYADIDDKERPSYRAFKAKWHGTPFQDPAIKASAFPDNKTTEMVFSWNGANNVAEYQLYGGDSRKDLKKIKKVKKTGFEDKYTADDVYSYVKVEALASNGSALADYTTFVDYFNVKKYDNVDTERFSKATASRTSYEKSDSTSLSTSMVGLFVATLISLI